MGVDLKLIPLIGDPDATAYNVSERRVIRFARDPNLFMDIETDVQMTRLDRGISVAVGDELLEPIERDLQGGMSFVIAYAEEIKRVLDHIHITDPSNQTARRRVRKLARDHPDANVILYWS